MKLNREYEYYEREKEHICNNYAGKCIVIVGEEIIGVYDDYKEAIRITIKQYELGSFFVKFVERDEVPAFIPRMKVRKNE